MSILKPTVHDRDHIQGNHNSKIELVEYGDYQCPHCRHAYPIVKIVQQALGNDLKFVFRNFPLSEIHPDAFSVAVATEAAGLQGKFWEMHDIIFENQQALGIKDLALYAHTIGLDADQFTSDMGRDDLSERVEQDFESGVRSGVNGTPSFFINGTKYNGSWEAKPLISYLESLK